LLQCLTWFVSRLTATSATPELWSMKLCEEDAQFPSQRQAGGLAGGRAGCWLAGWLARGFRSNALEDGGVGVASSADQGQVRLVGCNDARAFAGARMLNEREAGMAGDMGRVLGQEGPRVDAPVAEVDHLGRFGRVEEQLVLGSLRGNAARTVPE